MGGYRIFCLDGAGRISFAEEIFADDDEEAIAKTRELKRNTLKCEVWSGTRLVAKLDAHDLGG
jgi:hypothetical protein